MIINTGRAIQVRKKQSREKAVILFQHFTTLTQIVFFTRITLLNGICKKICNFICMCILYFIEIITTIIHLPASLGILIIEVIPSYSRFERHNTHSSFVIPRLILNSYYTSRLCLCTFCMLFF